MTMGNAQPFGSGDPLTLLEYCISDALSNDEETAGQILLDLNDVEHFRYRDRWDRAFTRQDVFVGLMRLLQSGRLGVFDDLHDQPDVSRLRNKDSIVDLWFQLTDSGRDALSKWAPAS